MLELVHSNLTATNMIPTYKCGESYVRLFLQLKTRGIFIRCSATHILYLLTTARALIKMLEGCAFEKYSERPRDNVDQISSNSQLFQSHG